MKPKRVNDELSISNQITTDDIPLIKAMGFKSLLCCRPDGEGLDQQLQAVISKVAELADLNTAYLPISRAGPTRAEREALQSLLASLPKPALAYSEDQDRVLACLGVPQSSDLE